MAYLALVRYVGDGLTKQFGVPFPYLDPNFVKCYVDGVPVDFTWITTGSIELPVAPPQGSVVAIRRETPLQRLVDYQNGSVMDEATLDLDSNQIMHVVQESYDNSEDALRLNLLGVYDAQGKRMTNLGDPVDPGDAMPKRYADVVISQAAGSAAAAASSATQAGNAASSAAASAATASQKAQVATEAANTATAKADAAASSAAQAAASASAAAASETNARNSATAAADSAAAAENAKTQAQQAASTATAQAGDAASSAASAAASAADAAASASAAADSASAAAASQDAAAQSVSAARAAEVKASKWADEAEDVEVEPGKYSARHWAKKALDSAMGVVSINGVPGAGGNIELVAGSGITVTPDSSNKTITFRAAVTNPVPITQLKKAQGSVSGKLEGRFDNKYEDWIYTFAPRNFDVHQYAFGTPYIYNRRRWQFYSTPPPILAFMTGFPSSEFEGTINFTVTWDYLTASGHPRVWVELDENDEIVAMWEAEDPADPDFPYDPPFEVSKDEEGNPLPGHAVIPLLIPDEQLIDVIEDQVQEAPVSPWTTQSRFALMSEDPDPMETLHAMFVAQLQERNLDVPENIRDVYSISDYDRKHWYLQLWLRQASRLLFNHRPSTHIPLHLGMFKVDRSTGRLLLK